MIFTFIFFGSNPNPDFWDSQSERFFGKGFEKLFLTSGFSKKKIVLTYVGGALREVWAILFHVCHLFKLLVDCF